MRLIPVIIAWSLASLTAFAAAPHKLSGSLKRALGGHAKDRVIGLHVVRLADGRTLAQTNLDTPLIPASVTKLVTTAAVLDAFTPAHHFETRLFHTGSRRGATVKGHLVIKGDGDPYLVSEQLWQMAVDLRHLGIRTFTGDIVIDNSLFSGLARDASRLSGRDASENAYDAPVSAFGVNFNTLTLALAPSERAGAPARVSLDPQPIGGVRLKNRLVTAAGRRRTRYSVKRQGGPGEPTVLEVTGYLGAHHDLVKVYRSMGDHVQTAGELVRSLLHREGITVRGSIREGRVPRGATELHTIKSYPMRKIIAGLNKFSNNYIADVLIKRLGAMQPVSGQPNTPGSGSYSNGLAAIGTFLRQKVGIKTPFVIKNGSGLSPANRLTARQVTTLLAYMERRLDLFPEYLSSLPASGWDGTLTDRFDGAATQALQGFVRAKTGTLTQPVAVSSLAGYLRHPRHGLLAFAILENGVRGKRQPSIAELRNGQDMALTQLAR